MSEYEKIIFETDEGEEEFYIIDDTKINEVNYILVTDAADPDAEEIEVTDLTSSTFTLYNVGNSTSFKTKTFAR